MAKYYRIVTIKSEIVDDEGNILKTEVKKRVYDLVATLLKMDNDFFNRCYTIAKDNNYDQLYLPKKVKEAYEEERGLLYDG